MPLRPHPSSVRELPCPPAPTGPPLSPAPRYMALDETQRLLQVAEATRQRLSVPVSKAEARERLTDTAAMQVWGGGTGEDYVCGGGDRGSLCPCPTEPLEPRMLLNPGT